MPGIPKFNPLGQAYRFFHSADNKPLRRIPFLELKQILAISGTWSQFCFDCDPSLIDYKINLLAFSRSPEMETLNTKTF